MFNLKSNKNILQEEIWENNYIDKENNTFIIEYSDYIKLNRRKTKIEEIGNKFAQINAFFLDYLNAYNIPTGFISTQKNRIILNNHIRFLFEITILNVINSRMAGLFGKNEGEILSIPVFEFRIGNSEDNFVNESHLISLDLCTNEEIKIIKRICSKINAVLKSFFDRRNCILAEYKCSFGKESEKIFVVNNFTPKSLIIMTNNINANKINKPGEFRNYTDFIFNLIK